MYNIINITIIKKILGHAVWVKLDRNWIMFFSLVAIGCLHKVDVFCPNYGDLKLYAIYKSEFAQWTTLAV